MLHMTTQISLLDTAIHDPMDVTIQLLLLPIFFATKPHLYSFPKSQTGFDAIFSIQTADSQGPRDRPPSRAYEQLQTRHDLRQI